MFHYFKFMFNDSKTLPRLTRLQGKVIQSDKLGDKALLRLSETCPFCGLVPEGVLHRLLRRQVLMYRHARTAGL